MEEGVRSVTEVLVALVSGVLGILGGYVLGVRRTRAGTQTGSGSPRSTKLSMKHFLFLSAGVVLVQVLSGFVIYRFFTDWSTRGTFGDMFGGVTALFSGLAFAGVVFAILLQRQELELQRQELEATREQLARSAEAQEKSEQALSQQVQTLRQSAEAQERAGEYSAISMLLEIYDTRLTNLQQRLEETKRSDMSRDEKVQRLNEIGTTIKEVREGRDALFKYLVGAFQRQIHDKLWKP